MTSPVQPPLPLGDLGPTGPPGGSNGHACRACGRNFATIEGFDAHRTGTYEPNTRRCLQPEEQL